MPYFNLTPANYRQPGTVQNKFDELERVDRIPRVPGPSCTQAAKSLARTWCAGRGPVAGGGHRCLASRRARAGHGPIPQLDDPSGAAPWPMGEGLKL